MRPGGLLPVAPAAQHFHRDVLVLVGGAGAVCAHMTLLVSAARERTHQRRLASSPQPVHGPTGSPARTLGLSGRELDAVLHVIDSWAMLLYALHVRLRESRIWPRRLPFCRTGTDIPPQRRDRRACAGPPAMEGFIIILRSMGRIQRNRRGRPARGRGLNARPFQLSSASPRMGLSRGSRGR